MAMVELTGCFGGATPVPAPGTNMLAGKLLFEKGQTLVLAGCDSRDAFLSKRNRVQAFAERMGKALRQHSVFVLACPSDSFLLELESQE